MKKVTLFLDKTLREKLTADRTWSLAYRAALKFLSEIVAYGSDPRIMGTFQQVEDCQVGFNKFTCGCHCESKGVRTAFAEAKRIEACMTLRPGLHALTLELRAFRAGEKEPFWKPEFSFNQDDGQPACAGSYDYEPSARSPALR